MISALSIIFQVVAVLILVDFFSGLFHWLEDSYCSEHTPIIGPLIIVPNRIHHLDPRHFTTANFWHRNAVTAFVSLLIFVVFGSIFGITWQLLLFCSVGALCNEYHCWAHRSMDENGRFISALHRSKIIQTPKHHAIHHTDPKNRAYCVLTNLLNPLLDRLELWRRAEAIIEASFGITPRPDPSCKNKNAKVQAGAIVSRPFGNFGGTSGAGVGVKNDRGSLIEGVHDRK